MFKPEGHNSLSPYLIVDDAQATLDFIKAVLNAEPDVVRKPRGIAAIAKQVFFLRLCGACLILSIHGSCAVVAGPRLVPEA